MSAPSKGRHRLHSTNSPNDTAITARGMAGSVKRPSSPV